MRKTVTEPGEPYPFQPLYGLQRTVSRLLVEGKKIPWAYKEYGVYAEENIYEIPGFYIGCKQLDKGRFYRLEDPTIHDLSELEYYWTDDKAR